MKKRVLCALCAAALLATGAMAGCSGGDNSKSDPVSKVESSAAESSKAEEASATTATDTKNAELKGLAATKVGRTKISTDKANFTSSGIIYQSNGKYGVVSIDGKTDTGAKYATAAEADVSNSAYSGFIEVATLASDNSNLNTHGLVDKTGTEIIPTKYGHIKVENNRYALVYTVDKKVDSESKAIVGFYDEKNEKNYYSGTCEVFDMEKKALVKNVTFKKAGFSDSYFEAKGKFLLFKNDDGRDVVMDDTGTEITDGRTIFYNGDYVMEINGKSAVYNSKDEKLFNFDSAEYSVYESSGDYYFAKDSSGLSFILNKSGEAASEKVSGDLSKIYPDFLVTYDNAYKLDGSILDLPFATTMFEFDQVNKDAYYVYNGNNEAIIDKNGNVLLDNVTVTDAANTPTINNFNAHNESGMYYNFRDKTYSINGSTVADWLVKTTEGKVMNLVDARTGANLLESYGDYKSVVDTADNILYVYAFNSVNGQTSKGDFDVYTVAVQ